MIKGKIDIAMRVLLLMILLLKHDIIYGFVVSGNSVRTRYLAAEKISTDSGLQYEDILVSDGKQPGEKDFVSAHYVAKFAEDGVVFDSSKPTEHGLEETRRPSFHNTPIQIPLGRGSVIKGLDEGVATMNVGSKRRLYIPAE